MITVYHIPICPFSQRLEILLALKGLEDRVNFHVVDITKPREDWLLEKSDGTTALPILETDDGKILKESLVILDYIEDLLHSPEIRAAGPYQRAVERMLIARCEPFIMAGYTFLMNQDRNKRDEFESKMLDHYRAMNQFLQKHAPDQPFLENDFGWVEAVYTPFFQRFWFLEYYEGFQVPNTEEFRRVNYWVQACLEHPAAQQVTKEEIVKLYFDYALGYGNGAVPEGRQVSSFVFEPDWRKRPMPPKEKYDARPSDAELGLL